MMRATRHIAAVLLLAVSGACSVGIPGVSSDVADKVAIEQDAAPPPPSELADVVESVLPSVVNVRVTSARCGDLGGVIEGQGEGSGVVLDEAGVIVTNAHVVADAVEVEVVFNDDHGSIAGEVVGVNAERDIAVIRVGARDLDPIAVGRSSNLRLGDDVVAIGFPLGLGGPTVTKGILSADDRTITTSGASGGGTTLEGLLQTDAAINPGNSGGALIDASGRLVGINTAAAQASAAENIGFAIAIDGALPVIEEILNEPLADRAWLGVSIGSVTEPGEAARLGLPSETTGALIVEIVAGGPAQSAGLDAGDVVTALDGEAIGSAEDLIRALSDHDPGDSVVLDVVGSGGDRSVEVELEPRPAAPVLNC